MGNHQGTIYWKKNKNDDYFIKELEKIRLRYNLYIPENDFSPLEKEYDKHYSVEISGVKILTTSYIKEKIKAFLFDATNMFKKYNIEAKTYEEYLPM